MTREAFVEQFSEADAAAIENAAAEHSNGVHDKRGSDAFRWSLLIAVGYECMSKPSYRHTHGIEARWDQIDAWMKEPAQRAWLSEHDGDVDYMALFVGAYNDYVPEPVA